MISLEMPDKKQKRICNQEIYVHSLLILSINLPDAYLQ